MKRLSKFHTAFCVLLFPLALVLAACATQTSGNTSTWQEQYDLGMRYLTESNYEEAILAFTAAIEIDPKQADPYVYLTQAYLALGNAEQAETTRLQGYEATGNVRLSQSVRSGWSIIYDDDIAFEQRIIYRDFHLMSTAQQDTLCQAIEAIQVDNQDAVRDILLNSDFPGQLCTTYNGYKINIFVFNKEEYKAYLDSYYGYMMQQGNISSEDGRVAGAEQAVGIELRPEHGRGYSYAWF